MSILPFLRSPAGNVAIFCAFVGFGGLVVYRGNAREAAQNRQLTRVASAAPSDTKETITRNSLAFRPAAMIRPAVDERSTPPDMPDNSPERGSRRGAPPPKPRILPISLVSTVADTSAQVSKTYAPYGILHIPESADMIINDGQHRCAAIKHAVERRPELKMETLGVVFYIDRGVKRARQMFSDLNGHPIRTNRNITTTFDSRPYLSAVTKYTIDRCDILRDRVELFASSCAVGSPRIFTISALDKAHGLLLKENLCQEVSKDSEICIRFWGVLEKCLPKVNEMIAGKVMAQDVKETYFYPYSIALQGLAASVNQLMKERPKTWERDLVAVGNLDWQRSNSEWEGRAMNAGRLTTGGNHPILTRNLIKRELKLQLSDEEQRIEDAFKQQNKISPGRTRTA